MSWIFSATTSQARSLLSMAKLNIARSRVLPSTWSLLRMDQTYLGRSGGLTPANFPLFHGCCFSREMKKYFDFPWPRSSVGGHGHHGDLRSLTLIPNVDVLLALQPEELGPVILKLAAARMQNGMFNAQQVLTVPAAQRNDCNLGNTLCRRQRTRGECSASTKPG